MSIDNYQQVFIVNGVVWSDATRDYTKPYTSPAFPHRADAAHHAHVKRVRNASIIRVVTALDKITYPDED